MPGNPSGLADIPGDSGGLTNWGISTTAWNFLHSRFPGFPATVDKLTQQDAEIIYQREYYARVHGDEMPSAGIAYVLFDAAVNQGAGTAVQILQRALGLKDDAVWGPKTAAAVYSSRTDLVKTVEDLCWERLGEYASDAKRKGKDSSYPWFLTILWCPRLLRVRTEALKMGV